MKIISVHGRKKTGKTTTVCNIIAELCRRGYKVSSMKSIHIEGFTMDSPNVDTGKHKTAGADPVTARCMDETNIMYKGSLKMADVLRHYDSDWTVVEGRTDFRCANIVAGKTAEMLEDRADDETICGSGVVSSSDINEFTCKASDGEERTLPVINSETDIEKLVNLIEQKAYEYVPGEAADNSKKENSNTEGFSAMPDERLFDGNEPVAIAFSGGTDSAYLLHRATEAGCRVCAYFINSEFQPKTELEDAVRTAEKIGVPLKVIDVSMLADDDIRANGPKRCYHCKKKMFSLIRDEAEKAGYSLVTDGTNASDDISDRPGMAALEELSVRSPLRECGLVKSEIRRLSGKAGLDSWDKPSFSCLAARIPEGTEITQSALDRIEASEKELAEMGFSDFRVCFMGDTCRIQVNENEMQRLMDLRKEITEKLKKYYRNVLLDLEGRN